MKVYTSPESLINFNTYSTRIFLAGSIEMGNAENWQEIAIRKLTQKNFNRENVCIFNPRRYDWDSSWDQNINDPQFHRQVSWELQALDQSTHIIMYLQPGTISPISLLELGLHAKSGKLIVVCPEGFHRKGNVDIVCERYGITQKENLEDIVDSIIFA